jgi:hypothetical protein
MPNSGFINKNIPLLIVKIRLSETDDWHTIFGISAFVLNKDALECSLPYLQVVFAMVQTCRTGV